MTRPIPRLALMGIACAAALTAAPGFAEIAPATSRGVILNALSVVNTADLDFGTLIGGTSSGTATVNPVSGARTTSGGTLAAGGTPQSAVFAAIGVANKLYIAALGAPPVLSDGSGNIMPVSVLMIDGPAMRLFGTGGVATIRVGGIMNVAANQPDGDYSGTFTLTVVYL